MSATALNLLKAKLEEVIQQKDEAIKSRTQHQQAAQNYDDTARILADEEMEIMRAIKAVQGVMVDAPQ